MQHQVLVVEDSRAFRHYLDDQLKQAGFKAIFAENLSQAKKLLAEPQRYLCAVLDYCLPDGQDGEIIDLVLSHKIKSIVLTAQFNDTIREKVLAKGVLDYLLKDSAASVAYLVPLLLRLESNLEHKALVVDDSDMVRNHVSHLLEKQNLTVYEASDGNEALQIIDDNPDISLVITDNDMPEKDGITMTREIRREHSRNKMAVLGLSGSNDSTMTAQFLKAGANDFLYKPFNQEEFNCRIHHILNMKDTSDKLYRMANQDALTGLWNRRYFFTHSCCQTEDEQLNIAMIDIDFFKKVNDTYGHDGGDAVLISISKIIDAHFPESIVARFGGEEFCIQHCGHFHSFLSTLELVRQRIESITIPYLDQQIKITISIGAATNLKTLDSLIKQADDNLYTAKKNGRNQLISN
ncbi:MULTISPECIES: response regulator [unclassified Photobacterium]|uniref:response regulator n=1 Tax=unclassified Photobacterium TaxID=2628852 RepID=UPI001EDE94B9|nr:MULTISPECIES: response regulator [unclassified Photobacterium]MCG3862435.1 diguanylate cyclase [Photobacterium sp. Ph6]MCG3874066.1 diguanylate cyclase [Photobacterium sp. Ph5]